MCELQHSGLTRPAFCKQEGSGARGRCCAGTVTLLALAERQESLQEQQLQRFIGHGFRQGLPELLLTGASLARRTLRDKLSSAHPHR